MFYAQIILPVPGPAYTYSASSEPAIGSAVEVEFGKKQVVGIVWRTSRELPADVPRDAKIKPVGEVLHSSPVVVEEQLRLWEWLAEYYMCSMGEVMRAALPAMVKKGDFVPYKRVRKGGADELQRNSDIYQLPKLSPAQQRALDELRAAPQDVSLLFGVPSSGKSEVCFHAIARALAAGRDVLLLLPEISLTTQFTGRVRAVFGEEVMLCHSGLTDRRRAEVYLRLSHKSGVKSQESGVRSQESANAGGKLGDETIRRLGDEAIRRLDDEAIRQLDDELTRHRSCAAPKLRGADVGSIAPQQSDVGGGRNEPRECQPSAWRGGGLRTSNEVRANATQISAPPTAPSGGADGFSEAGKPAALPHDRLITHDSSLLTPDSLLMTPIRGRLVVGTRSAIFLPFNDLGLVVVDEEQDGSYKQQDPAPRYNARDAAIVLAKMYGAKTILVSATPSLETWANATGARNGKSKYALVELRERFGGTMPPEVTISDTLRAAKRGERKSHFNKELTDRIRGVLARGEQAILFQNRRGVAPWLECESCGWVPTCEHCAIPLTVHRKELRCHYCGFSMALPKVCRDSTPPAALRLSSAQSRTPECAPSPRLSQALQPTHSDDKQVVGHTLVTRGFGTEKIEDELALLFPEARVARLDRDSAGSERAYNQILGGFERGEVDILVGTQMVTKGLDFAGVSLVGVLNADNLLNYPDFRASERAYQLIAQVAGRAGRRDTRGEVVIQTAAAGNPIIGWAAAGDWLSMAAEVLAERSTYGYPPYSRLISIMLRHWDAKVLYAAAGRFGELLRGSLKDISAPRPPISILGPQPPVTERVKGEYALVFLLKIPRGVALASVRAVIRSAAQALVADPKFRRVVVTPNVDPQ